MLGVVEQPDTILQTYEPDDGPRRLGPPPFRPHPGPGVRQARRHPRDAEGGDARRRQGRPAGAAVEGQADPGPVPLFLPPRLGRHRRGAAAVGASGPPPSAPPPASRRPPNGTASKAGSEIFGPLWRSSARMEIIVDAARGGAGDAGDLLDILERGVPDRAGRAEMHQQGALAARADAGDVVERAGGEALGALLRGGRRWRSGAPRRAAAGGRRARARSSGR